MRVDPEAFLRLRSQILARFENCENMGNIKISTSVHTIPAQFENKRKFDSAVSVSKRLDVTTKKFTSVQRIDQTRFERVEKRSAFIVFKCSQITRHHFQIPLFSKFAGNNLPFSCGREPLP